MTPEQLVTVILVVLGVLIQLAIKYANPVYMWYENHPQKGLVTLGLDALIGASYFGLSCTPYVSEFNIALTCDQAGLFILLRAIFIIATAQQMTYLVTRNGK